MYQFLIDCYFKECYKGRIYNAANNLLSQRPTVSKSASLTLQYFDIPVKYQYASTKLALLNIVTVPLQSVKRISGVVQMYSTVGVRLPICRRSTLLKIWAASFFPSKSIRCRLGSSINNTSELYISCK
jgi:hypothetical protein